MDGVIADFAKFALASVNKKFKANYRIEDWTTWSAECFGKDVAEYVHQLGHDPAAYKMLEPIDGALDGLKELSTFAEIWIITSRPAECEQVTQKWLVDMSVPYSTLAFSSKKHLWVGAYMMDAFVEDKLDAAVQISKYTSLSIVLDHPSNRQHDNGIVRCKNWDEIIALLKRKLS